MPFLRALLSLNDINPAITGEFGANESDVPLSLSPLEELADGPVFGHRGLLSGSNEVKDIHGQILQRFGYIPVISDLGCLL